MNILFVLVMLGLSQPEGKKDGFDLIIYSDKSDSDSKTVAAIVTAKKLKQLQENENELESPELTLFQEITGISDRIIVRSNKGRYSTNDGKVILNDNVIVSSASNTIKGSSDELVWSKQSGIILNGNPSLSLKDTYIQAKQIAIDSAPGSTRINASEVTEFLSKTLTNTIKASADTLTSVLRSSNNSTSVESIEFSDNVSVSINTRQFKCKKFDYSYVLNSGILAGSPSVLLTDAQIQLLTPLIRFRGADMIANPPIVINLTSKTLCIKSNFYLDISNHGIKLGKSVINDSDKVVKLKSLSISGDLIKSYAPVVIYTAEAKMRGNSISINTRTNQMLVGPHVIIYTNQFLAFSPLVDIKQEKMIIGSTTYKSVFYKRR